MNVDAQKIGVAVMQSMTLELNFSDLSRGAFGWLGWRRRVAISLCRVAAFVLRCGIEIK